MTDDIVDRLRQCNDNWNNEGDCYEKDWHIWNEAATEIERLRSELEKVNVPQHTNSWNVRYTASFGQKYNPDELVETLTKAVRGGDSPTNGIVEARPSVSQDDIVVRLTTSIGHSPSECWSCGEWGCTNSEGKEVPCWCENECSHDNNCNCNCHEWYVIVNDAKAEIENLLEQNEYLKNVVNSLLVESRQAKYGIEDMYKDD